MTSMVKQGVAGDRFPAFVKDYNDIKADPKVDKSLMDIQLSEGPQAGSGTETVEYTADSKCKLIKIESCNSISKPDNWCYIKLSFKQDTKKTTCMPVIASSAACKKKDATKCSKEDIDGDITRIRMFNQKLPDAPSGFTLWTTMGTMHKFGVQEGSTVETSGDWENKGVARIVGVTTSPAWEKQANSLAFMLAIDTKMGGKKKGIPDPVKTCKYGTECVWGMIVEGELACYECFGINSAVMGLAVSGISILVSALV